MLQHVKAPRYDWSCKVCESVNPGGVTNCEQCGFSAFATPLAVQQAIDRRFVEAGGIPEPPPKSLFVRAIGRAAEDRIEPPPGLALLPLALWWIAVGVAIGGFVIVKLATTLSIMAAGIVLGLCGLAIAAQLSSRSTHKDPHARSNNIASP